MTALLHSLIVFEKRGLFYFWVITLCLLTFILSVTGTFLVRSGILNSVHTFASDPTRGIYILLFLTLMIFSSIFLLFKKYDNINLDYKIFTTQFDEITKAENLENADEATKLRKSLDQQLVGFQDVITKLANKLQRQLLAKTK